MMTIEMESMAVAMPEVEGHPNRVDFRGVLTVVDVPSQKAPHGSKGHRVVLTRAAAEEALPSLLGMALDYAPSFDRHDARRKVGVITSADVVGRNLEVGGYLYAKDFPEIVEEVSKSGRRPGKSNGLTPELRPPGPGEQVTNCRSDGAKLRASLANAVVAIRSLTEGIRKEGPLQKTPIAVRAETNGDSSGTGLGMSFELTGVNVLDRRARLWTLTKVTFTGAAILRKSKAAYEDTWIELKY
jgi:hypothetical protein